MSLPRAVHIDTVPTDPMAAPVLLHKPCLPHAKHYSKRPSTSIRSSSPFGFRQLWRCLSTGWCAVCSLVPDFGTDAGRNRLYKRLSADSLRNGENAFPGLGAERGGRHACCGESDRRGCFEALSHALYYTISSPCRGGFLRFPRLALALKPALLSLAQGNKYAHESLYHSLFSSARSGN